MEGDRRIEEDMGSSPILPTVLWANILTDQGHEWLSWYLYDKDGVSGNPRDDLKAHDGKKEICKNIKDLHSYLKKNRYFNTDKDNL